MNNIMFMTSYLLGKMRKIYFMALPENKRDMKKSRICFTIGDSAAQTIVQLAGGTFIVALMSSVNISDANIGLITSLATLSTLFQLLVMSFVNQLSKYKLFICLMVFMKILFALIYFVPLLNWPIKGQILTIIGGFSIAQICSQISNPPIQDWIASLVPTKLRGRYFAIKDSIAVFVTVSIMLLAGIMLDFARTVNEELGFILIGALLTVLVLVNLIAFSCMKEPRTLYTDCNVKEMHGHLAKHAKLAQKHSKKCSLSQEFKTAFGSSLFKKALFLNLLWMTAFYIAAPFNSSYQIKELALPYTFIMIVGFLSNLLRIYIMPKIGVMADRYGMAKVFKYFLLSLMLNYLLTAFSLPGNARIMMPLSSLFSAVGWAFVGIGMFGIQLQFLDKTKRMVQLSILSAISGVYGFIVSFLGSRFMDYLQHSPVSLWGQELYAQQVLNVLGALLLIITFLYTKFKIQPFNRKE